MQRGCWRGEWHAGHGGQQMTIPDYGYQDAEVTWALRYLHAPVLDALHACAKAPARVFELGSGSGWLAARCASEGYQVTGIDPSLSGVAQARQAYPNVRYEVAST